MGMSSLSSRGPRITLSRALGNSKEKQLIMRVQAGGIRETKRLLKAGAWVNGGESEEEGCPPLVAAAMGGQTTVAKVLLKAGPDIEIAVTAISFHLTAISFHLPAPNCYTSRSAGGSALCTPRPPTCRRRRSACC